MDPEVGIGKETNERWGVGVGQRGIPEIRIPQPMDFDRLKYVDPPRTIVNDGTDRIRKCGRILDSHRVPDPRFGRPRSSNPIGGSGSIGIDPLFETEQISLDIRDRSLHIAWRIVACSYYSSAGFDINGPELVRSRTPPLSLPPRTANWTKHYPHLVRCDWGMKG